MLEHLGTDDLVEGTVRKGEAEGVGPDSHPGALGRYLAGFGHGRHEAGDGAELARIAVEDMKLSGAGR